MQTVFVYGTLRHTHANDWMMKQAGGHFVADDKIRACRVSVMKSLPGIVPHDDGVVEGELYHISDDGLRALDRFEGHPTFYERKEVTTIGGVKAWSYWPDERYVTSGKTEAQQSQAR